MCKTDIVIPNRLAVFFVLALTLLASCTNNNPVGGSSNMIVRGDNALARLVGAGGSNDYVFMAYSQKWDTWVYDRVSGTSHTLPGDSIQVFHGEYENGGTLMYNGSALTAAGAGTASFNKGCVPGLMPLDGTMQTWTASRSGLTTFQVNLKSPHGFAKVTSPTNAQTVSDTSDLVVTWDKTSSDELVAITLEYTGLAPGSSQIVNYPSFVYLPDSDDGSYTIPMADLKSMPAGAVAIVLRRGYSVKGISPNSKSYVAYNYTLHSATVNLIH